VGQRGTGGWRGLPVSCGRREVPGGSGGARVGIGEAGDSVAGTLVSLVDEGVSIGRTW